MATENAEIRKFTVFVDKTITESVSIRVEATEPNEAMAKALHRAVVDFDLNWESDGNGISYRVQWSDDDGTYD